MYNDILGYLDNASDDLNFNAWKLVTAVVLPNLEFPSKKRQKEHHILSKLELSKIERQEETIFEILEIKDKFWYAEEYETIATVFMASIHSATIFPKKDIPILQEIPSEVEQAHEALAGKDAPAAGPGFDQKLVSDVESGKLTTGVSCSDIWSIQKERNEKAGVNSLFSWIFWSPDQFETIHRNPERLIITGPFGTGKSLVLMALALAARQAGKRVGFMSCTPLGSVLDSTTNAFCMRNKINFLPKEGFYSNSGVDIVT